MRVYFGNKTEPTHKCGRGGGKPNLAIDFFEEKVEGGFLWRQSLESLGIFQCRLVVPETEQHTRPLKDHQRVVRRNLKCLSGAWVRE